MIISKDFECGVGFRHGDSLIIEDDVKVGTNVKLGHNVTLKSGTRFGNNIDFADYCKTTGLCYLGNNVNVRTGACISKGVIVEDWAFIGPGVMTNHTKNVVHGRPWLDHYQHFTRIGYGAIIGSNVQINAGSHIGDNVVVGSGACVVKPILEPGIYVGNTAKKIKDLSEDFIIPRPEFYEEFRFPLEMIQKYLPKALSQEK